MVQLLGFVSASSIGLVAVITGKDVFPFLSRFPWFANVGVQAGYMMTVLIGKFRKAVESVVANVPVGFFRSGVH